jgi:uncharacterized membrane protein
MCMWTRSELKANAKNVLKHCYWDGVLLTLICGIVSYIGSLMVGIVAVFFLSLPLTVGLNYFYMQAQVAPSRLQNVFYPFEGGRYLKIVGAMAWMYLFITLWSLIAWAGFIIVMTKWIATLLPLVRYKTDFYALLDVFRFDQSWISILVACGVIFVAGTIIAVIKSLSYSMTAYILTDNPYIGYDRALKLSIAMTYGHKWRMFVLYLSFAGWVLLSLLTLGIGSIFLTPYISATQAQLYAKLRDNAINSGLTTASELNVYLKQ